MYSLIHNSLASKAEFDIRDEVAEMAKAMEAKLRKNDHKTGWHNQPIEAHLKLLKIEMMEFDVALEFLGDEEAAKECVDIANFALIIRDKLLARIKAKKETEQKCTCSKHTGYCPEHGPIGSAHL